MILTISDSAISDISMSNSDRLKDISELRPIPILRGTLRVQNGNSWVFDGNWGMTPESYDDGVMSPFKYSGRKETSEVLLDHYHPAFLRSATSPDLPPCVNPEISHPVYFSLRARNINLPSACTFNGYFVMKLQGNKQMKVEESNVKFVFSVLDETTMEVTATGENKFGVFDLTGYYDIITGDVLCQKNYRPVPIQHAQKEKKSKPSTLKRPSAALPSTTLTQVVQSASRSVAEFKKNEALSVSDLDSMNGSDQVLGRSTRKRKAPPKELGSDSEVSPTMKICLGIVKKMMQHKWSAPFNIPVDPGVLGLPDYFHVVKQPRDFGSIKEAIESGECSSVEGFTTDMRLVFFNAKLYNKAGSDIHIMAEAISKAFESALKLSQTALRKLDQGTGGGPRTPVVSTSSSRTRQARTPSGDDLAGHQSVHETRPYQRFVQPYSRVCLNA